MKRIVAGILAHVDAGKTTLSEALLYATGQVRKLGRVDHGDAFLDTDAMERQRGITIFTEPAVIATPDLTITLLDTPGHVDFSAETERTLAVLDYAILVISGAHIRLRQQNGLARRRQNATARPTQETLLGRLRRLHRAD